MGPFFFSTLHHTTFFSSRKKADWKTFGWRKMQPIMVKLVCLLQLHFKQTLLVQAFSGGFTDKLPDSSHHGPLTTETQKGLQWLLAEALCNALEDPFSFSKIFFSSGFQTLWCFVVFLAEKVLTRKTLQNAFHFFVCVYFYFAADFFLHGYNGWNFLPSVLLLYIFLATTFPNGFQTGKRIAMITTTKFPFLDSSRSTEQ